MLKNTSFKKLLLNPGLSYNVDEDGNDPTSGDNSQIVDPLQGHEGVSGSSISGVSKLRARNALSLADTDKRYQGKTVKRAELEEPEEKLHQDYDPSLARFLYEEETDEENDDEENDGENDGESDDEEIDEESDDEEIDEESEDGEIDEHNATNESKSNDLADDFERFADDDFEENSDDEEEEVEHGEDDEEDDSMVEHDDDSSGDSDTGYEDASDSQANSDEGSGHQEESGDEGTLKVAGLEDLSEEQQKAKSVMRQLGLYDKLFTNRIAMQKVMRGSLQLPLPPARQAFLGLGGEAGDRFAGCLEAATAAAGGLVQELLRLQEALLKSNPESKCVLKGDPPSSAQEASKRKAPLDDDDEEITSSEDESDEEGKGSSRKKQDHHSGSEEEDSDCSDDNSTSKTGKRKRGAECDIAELEETLAKRHRAMRPYRNKVVAFWDERTRLLQAQQTKGKDGKGGAFAAFDEGFGVMVRRLLADRDKLLKRTQLRSIHRENFSAPIGCKEAVFKQEVDADLDIPAASAQSAFERYDPEIYDDTDFYCRYMDELIKDKHRRGTSGLTTAQLLDFQQKLRKKTKKVVDTRRSKGRKLKYDVQSSLLQYLPPCGTTIMEDDAVEQVTMSLFGGCHNKPASADTAQR